MSELKNHKDFQPPPIVRPGASKIAFFCGGDGVTFLWDIGMFAKERFNVWFFEGQSAEGVAELMEWSDISWFEWCTDLTAFASQLPKVCKSIVRLHRYEVFTGWPGKVMWENIDALITVGNDYVKDRLLAVVGGIEKRTRMVEIPNGINLAKFAFTERQRGKNIAFVGNMNMKKNPAFLLHCFARLQTIDPEYRLYFAGRIQDGALEQYMRYMVRQLGLDGVVFFDGWQEDVSGWLADKHYIVCSSIVEGHPVGVLEGMARGLKPVIHNFPGSKKFFPAEFLFDTAAEFCERIASGPYEVRRYREFVEARYSLSEQLGRVNELFMELGACRPSHGHRAGEAVQPAGMRNGHLTANCSKSIQMAP
jgi:glycosyltransferase involved in cell wall biosynthesis